MLTCPSPKGSFFDYAVAHVLTTNTLNRLRELYPQGRFEPRRFRPNVIVAVGKGEPDFVENSWVGLIVEIGETLMNVTKPSPAAPKQSPTTAFRRDNLLTKGHLTDRSGLHNIQPYG